MVAQYSVRARSGGSGFDLLVLQTIFTAKMMSVGGESCLFYCSCTVFITLLSASMANKDYI